MDDLIRRQDAIDAIYAQSDDDGMYAFTALELEQWIQALPSAEPEIIHCRDCKYAHLTYDGFCKHCDKWVDENDMPLTVYLDGDFYCGFAERRTDE